MPRSCKEARIFLEAAHRRYPDRFRGALLLREKDLVSQNIEELLFGLGGRPGMLAFRVIIRRWKDEVLSPAFLSGAYEPGVLAAEEYGVPMFITASGYLSTLRPVAESHPALTVILDHCGLKQQPNVVSTILGMNFRMFSTWRNFPAWR